MRRDILVVAAWATAFIVSTAHANASSTNSALDVAISSSNSEFDVVIVPMSATAWAAIKYNAETGESWSAYGGKWYKIEDEPGIPKGRYIIKMTALSNDWAAMRLEVKTGKSWQCQKGMWVEIAHAAMPPADVTVDTKSSKK
jgi:hypothetical protein